MASSPEDGQEDSEKAEQVADANVDKDKKICRTEKVTGSRTRVNRICLTRAQWDELHRNTKMGLDEMGRAANHPNSANPNSGM